jgi:maltose alpha-D-glucosyltransferase/alpha-amylase
MKQPEWLNDAVFYQIYPQSFFDTNGDGIGDLPGIEQKLDYIASLGVNALWLNPCFESPFMDAGYDVADYRKVAPRYGTNRDLKRLFRAAAKRGIRICLDLVPGHTSIEHPWFKASCRAKPNRHTNWYVWNDSVWKGADPWPCVRGYAERDAAYVPNFFWFQPALNFGFGRQDEPWQLPPDHPDIRGLRREFRETIRFWLDQGCGGFRVDMAASLVRNDPGGAVIREYWQGVRAMLDRDYPEAVLISEWGYPPSAISAGFHLDFLLHFGPPAYTSLFRLGQEGAEWQPEARGSFFSRHGKGNIRAFLDPFLDYRRETLGRGHIALPSSNHDMSRLAYGRSRKDLAVAFAFILTMPTVPFIYYGDEIGMDYVRGLVSKEGGYQRTGSRTPMQWTDGRNAGFSTAPAAELYLPVDGRKNRPSVERHEGDRSSPLNTVRRLIALRAETPALKPEGAFIPLYARARKYPFIYERTLGAERVLVALNPGSDKADATIEPTYAGARLAMGSGRIEQRRGRSRVSVPGRGYAIWQA